MRKSRNCSLTVEIGSLQRSRSSHSTPGSSPSYAGGPPCASKNQPSWKSLNPSSSQPSRHSLLASWPMTYWCPVSCTMRPIDALPSMIIMGNSVPPPSTRCTLRSEEHTSELQSRGHLVCRLLLEKKKKKRQKNIYNIKHVT